MWGADTGKERGGRRVQGWGQRQQLLLRGVCGGVRTAASTRRGEVNGFEGLVAAASS